MKRVYWVASMLAAFLLAAGTARAQNVDDKIKSLEQELGKLKEQQIELKKDATAAAEALPTFSYRPGNGLNVEAADKSWGLRTTIESHFRMYFIPGQDQFERTNGEIEARRFRPGFFYCIDNCLWEIEATFDLDGFGGNSLFQRAVTHFHAENLNPWLPTVDFGVDVSTSAGGTIRQGSSATGTQADYDLLSRNNGFNTGSSGIGIVFNWDDRSLSDIGIPGRITRLQLAYATPGKGSDNTFLFTDRRDFVGHFGIEPFSEVKNKWISGLRYEVGWFRCAVDDRAQASNSCNRSRLQENENNARAFTTIYDTGTLVGRGRQDYINTGLQWTVGPYRFRGMLGFNNYSGGNNAVNSAALRGDPSGRVFLIAHDLFIWSPKGWLTGSASTPGSILFGTHFERDSMRCNNCPAINGGQFHRERVLL
ncbi:MAG TPA: hypothetical protein VK603_12760, partial [Candidatus Saccharimonadales bacterium]|nr:hypothetical protein [Candidatus Saccharimonadales bacterium]